MLAARQRCTTCALLAARQLTGRRRMMESRLLGSQGRPARASRSAQGSYLEAASVDISEVARCAGAESQGEQQGCCQGGAPHADGRQ